MTLLARATLIVWLVSFTFYAGVVIPFGTAVNGAAQQGLVTERVTGVLNWIGLFATAGAAYLTIRVEARRRRWLWLLCLAMFIAQVALLPLRANLSGMLDHDLGVVREGTNFYRWHQAYLWVSTVQWLSTIGFLTLTSWRSADARL